MKARASGINFTFAGTNQIVALGANTNWQDGAVAEKAYTISGTDAPTVCGRGRF